jgi:hypothetical protein
LSEPATIVAPLPNLAPTTPLAHPNGWSKRRLPLRRPNAYDSRMNPFVLESALIVVAVFLFWLLDRYVIGCEKI